MRVLHLYTTLGCHLCEEAAAMVKNQQVPDLTLDLIEIIDSESLLEKYGIRIPVLKFQHAGSDEDAELAWPFTDEELAIFLTGS